MYKEIPQYIDDPTRRRLVSPLTRANLQKRGTCRTLATYCSTNPLQQLISRNRFFFLEKSCTLAMRNLVPLRFCYDLTGQNKCYLTDKGVPVLARRGNYWVTIRISRIFVACCSFQWDILNIMLKDYIFHIPRGYKHLSYTTKYCFLYIKILANCKL